MIITPCYHPNFVALSRTSSPSDDVRPASFRGPVTKSNLHLILDNNDPVWRYVPIKCGVCRGCRLDRGKQWADRLLLEYADNPHALFVTITYDDEHVPMIKCLDDMYRATLQVRDMQLYLKRLRRYFGDIKLRVFYAGEYGESTFRPHYHMILYGLDMIDVGGMLWEHDPESGHDLYLSPLLNQLWDRGRVLHAKANYHTFSYVARYVLKKQFGPCADDFYFGRVKPFCQMSRKPALGSRYFDDGIEFDRVSLSDGESVHDISVPRCVLDKIKLTQPEIYDNIKTNQALFAESRQALLIDQLDPYLNYLDYLSELERGFVRKTKILDRKDSGL